MPKRRSRFRVVEADDENLRFGIYDCSVGSCIARAASNASAELVASLMNIGMLCVSLRREVEDLTPIDSLRRTLVGSIILEIEAPDEL